LYYVGLIICALAFGHEFTQFTGWAILGTGLIFAGLWNAVAGGRKTITEED
jgi:hypothetical protein